jgi:LysW-gamma-L-lysine carboxypeptidase
VQDQDYIDLIVSAVGIRSPSGEEAAVAAFLAEWMGAHGLAARVDEAGNAVGERGNGKVTVLLLGHIDTVPGDIPVRVEEGVLWGRGSVDAKGPFCSFAAAATSLPEWVFDHVRVVCVGAVEEESPTSKGARHALTRYSPDYCVIGEPSGWDAVTLGYKGRLVARAERTKANFHSAGDDTTAAEDVVGYWNAVRAWADGRNAGQRLFDSVQVTLQGVNSTSDGLEQRAQATIGLRLPPSLGPTQAESELRALAPEGVTISATGHEEPYRGPKDTPLTRAFRTAIRGQGGEPRLTLKTGTSDMNVVAPQWAGPILAYGPGDSSLDHRPDERLDLAEFLNAVRVLRSAIERIADNARSAR